VYPWRLLNRRADIGERKNVTDVQEVSTDHLQNVGVGISNKLIFQLGAPLLRWSNQIFVKNLRTVTDSQKN
jgi:hypothetical protein